MLSNSTTDGKMPAASTQERSIRERGIYVTTLQYTMRDQATGGLSRRQAMIPTDIPILPELQWLYDETLRLAPIVREQLSVSGEANFFLVDRDLRVIGCMCLEMRDLSDRDLAWINCLLAENEGAVLALVPEPMMADRTPHPTNFKKLKRKRRRS
jgi:hypothetical protein